MISITSCYQITNTKKIKSGLHPPHIEELREPRHKVECVIMNTNTANSWACMPCCMILVATNIYNDNTSCSPQISAPKNYHLKPMEKRKYDIGGSYVLLITNHFFGVDDNGHICA